MMEGMSRRRAILTHAVWIVCAAIAILCIHPWLGLCILGLAVGLRVA
jgi:hypothetical protein